MSFFAYIEIKNSRFKFQDSGVSRHYTTQKQNSTILAIGSDATRCDSFCGSQYTQLVPAQFNATHCVICEPAYNAVF